MKNMWISTAMMTLVRLTNTDIKQWTLLTPAFIAFPISGLFLVANTTCGCVMCYVSRHHCSVQFYIYLTQLSNSILCFCFQIVSQIFPWRGLGEEATMEEYIKWGLICITSTYAKAAFWTRYHFVIVFGTPVIMSVIG